MGVGACVDGPLDAREKARSLTGGSIAIMCPALSTRPYPLAQMGSAIQTQTLRRLRKPVHQAGSLDRRFDRSSSHSALSPRHQRAIQAARLMPLGRDARYLGPYQSGHLV